MSCFNSAPFTNNSNHDVIIRPEDYSDDDQNNIIVPPGSTYYSGVDGVWVEGKGWYKIPDFVETELTENGKFKQKHQWTGQELPDDYWEQQGSNDGNDLPGQKGEGFEKRHKEWLPPSKARKATPSELKNWFDRFIDSIKGLFGAAEQVGSPLTLDLDGDGVETLGQDAGVFFDHDANGFAQLSGWVAPDDGLLVWDRNGNGQIDDGSELFGNNSLLANGQKAANGFAALAELDKNGDGVLDANDAAFAALRVWRDKNSDGKVGEGELLTLDELGIQSLGTNYKTQNVTDASGNQHLQVGSFTFTDAAGNTQTYTMTDVWFGEDRARSLPIELVEVSEEIAALPDVMAFGNVYSLHQAMARDGSGALRALVEQFGAEADPEKRAAILEQLIYTWAGVADVAPTSRGNTIDARKLATLEAFLGTEFRQWGNANPGGDAALRLKQAFAILAQYIDGQLMAQTHLAPVLAGIKLSIDPETWELSFDFSRSMALLQESWTADSGRCSALLQSLVHYLGVYGEAGERVLDAFRDGGDLYGDAFAFAVASAGLQVLRPGTGDKERLSGTAGDDLYLIAPRGGQEITISSGEGKDRLRFGEGIGLSDISLEKSGNDLIIRVGESGQSVKLADWYYPNYVDRRVDVFAFADGRSLSWQELLAQKAVSLATEGGQLDGNEGVDDVLRGSTLAKAGSTETLRGLGGRDRLYAGLSSTAYLYGGRDDDQLFTNAVATKSYLYGEEGDDLLVNQSGSAATTRMRGGAGSDEYLIQAGSGETVIELDGDEKSTDTLRFGEGIGLSDISLEKSGNDLIIRVGEGGQSVKLADWYYPNYADRRVDVFAFADGRSLSWQELLAQKAVTLATEGGQLNGNEGVDDVLRGSTLAKAGSTETLRGLGGRDRLYAGLSSTAYLYGGRDDDQLFTNAVATKSYLYGEEGDDLLVNQSGSAATTRMRGGAGSDEYLIQAGSGETVIELDGDTESTDTLRFGEGIGLSDISLEKSGNDLIIRVGEGGQSVKLADWYYVHADRRVDVFAFADGRSLSWQELLAQKAVSAANGGYLQGNEGLGDILSGGSKSTVLTGGSGADVFLFRDALDETNNVDRITDFKPGEDKLHLSRSVFTALSEAGPLADSLFVANATGSALDDRDCILYNTTTGALLYDPDGTGAGAAIQFARLDSRPELKASDFFVVK